MLSFSNLARSAILLNVVSQNPLFAEFDERAINNTCVPSRCTKVNRRQDTSSGQLDRYDFMDRDARHGDGESRAVTSCADGLVGFQQPDRTDFRSRG